MARLALAGQHLARVLFSLGLVALHQLGFLLIVGRVLFIFGLAGLHLARALSTFGLVALHLAWVFIHFGKGIVYFWLGLFTFG